jgi:hypothetical protein
MMAMMAMTMLDEVGNDDDDDDDDDANDDDDYEHFLFYASKPSSCAVAPNSSNLGLIPRLQHQLQRCLAKVP